MKTKNTETALKVRKVASEEEMAQALEECAREPIHIPGAIQPHGVMLILDPENYEVKGVSENISSHLHQDVQDVLNVCVSKIIGEENATNLKRIITKKALQPLQFIRIKLDGKLWDANAHRSDHFVVFELEPVHESDKTVEDDYMYDELRGFTIDMRGANDLDGLYNKVVEHVKRMTDFDRVMLYKFDDQWNGKVIAECKEGDVPGYLGLNFPASDIPEQARKLYSKSYLRMISDIKYAPSKIVGCPSVADKMPVDMTHSVLRSVSPVHIQYLENMGVGATMVTSIMQNDKLWGMVVGHHLSPKYVPYRHRMICELMGHIFSTLLTSFNDTADKEEQEARTLLLEKLSTALTVDEGTVPNVLEEKFLLAKTALRADGMVLFFDGEIRQFGHTPEYKTLEDLYAYLRDKHTISVLQTNDASNHFENVKRLDKLSGGVLAVPVSHKSDDFVIWFRKPIIEDIKWAGEAEKTVEETVAGYRLAPRSSFEIYKQTIQKTSPPWRSIDLETALSVIRLILEYEKSTAKIQSQYKSDFLASMSHELRTPMNAITGIVNILDKDHTLTDKQRELVKTLNISSDGLLTLLNDLLDLSKIEANTAEIEHIQFNLAEILENARSMMGVRANEKGLQLNLNYPQKQDLNFYGDPTKIRQIVLNLLSNSIKFTQEGFVNVLVQLKEAHIEGQKRVCLSVSDTGIGMSDKQLEKVFDKFTQADKSIARNYGGTGLGLSISKNFVEMMGGTITATSRENLGSQFLIELPLSQVEPSSQTSLKSTKSHQVERKADKISKTKKRVLLAEDYEGNIVVAIYFLQEMNIETYVVNNGKEAIEAMQSQIFDAVFMDVQMPVMDGLEATRKIRELQEAGKLYQCPIIGMTANAFVGDKRKCFDAGMDDYLSKPFSNDDLEEAVQKFLK